MQGSQIEVGVRDHLQWIVCEHDYGDGTGMSFEGGVYDQLLFQHSDGVLGWMGFGMPYCVRKKGPRSWVSLRKAYVCQDRSSNKAGEISAR
jgi:hypothetical protein